MLSTRDAWPSKEGLRIGYLNINHAINKLDDIGLILENSGKHFHLFCFSESRLDSRIMDSDLMIPGYNTIRRDPESRRETGLLLYFSETIKINRIVDLECFDVESLWIEVKLKHVKPLLIGFMYRNPAERVIWYNNFAMQMDAAILRNNEIMLLGDFNIDLSKDNLNWTQQYKTLNLTQLVDRPTRIADNTSTLIDHIYVTSQNNIVEVCSPVFACSDHFPICLTWAKKGIKIPKTAHKEISYRCFKNFDEKKFLSDLANSNLSLVYQYTNPDDAIDHWISVFSYIYDKHATIKTKRVKDNPKPPWITNEIIKAIRLRDTLKAKKDPMFKTQRNNVTKMKRTAKKITLKILFLIRRIPSVYGMQSIGLQIKQQNLSYLYATSPLIN